MLARKTYKNNKPIDPTSYDGYEYNIVSQNSYCGIEAIVNRWWKIEKRNTMRVATSTG